jgi:hypothetical protein
MRRRFLLLGAVVLFLSSVMAESALTQQQPQQQQPQQQAPQQPGAGGGVQVGVPAGRGPAPTAAGRGRQTGPPPGPTPRTADGHVILGGAKPSEKGVWLPGGGGGQTLEGTIPFQPWARAVLDDRQKNQLEPHTRCKPSGATRQFLTPYGVEFVDLPEIQRVYIFDIGGPHTYRTVYMDGRVHPADLAPSYYGHSIGWWDGDTLVVDTVGYNEGFWMDRRGSPHTDKLHTIERFTRTDSATMKYEITVDDPGAYTSEWKSTFNLRWEAGTELFEYVCQQANYAPELMVGQQKKIDRTSVIVP